MNKELKTQAKHTSLYITQKHKRLSLIIVWLVASFLFAILGLAVIWFIGLSLWPVVVIVSIVKQHNLLKQITRQMEEGTFQDEAITGQRNHKAAAQQKAATRIAGDAGASYAIGKAVTGKISAAAERGICFDPDYAKDCATCEFWNGNREAIRQSNHWFAECDSKRVTGKCGNGSATHFYNITRTADSGCRWWTKWNQL